MLSASLPQLHVVCSASYLERQPYLSACFPCIWQHRASVTDLNTHSADWTANSLCVQWRATFRARFPLGCMFSRSRVKNRVKRSKKDSTAVLKSRIRVKVTWHLLACLSAPRSSHERTIMRSVKYLSISRAEIVISHVIGQCYCSKAFKMRILTDRKH